MYLTYGLIGLLSVFVPTLIGYLFTRQNPARTLGIAFFVGLVYSGILAFIYWSNSVDFYGPTPAFWSLIVGFVIAAIIAGSSEDDGTAVVPGAAFALIAFVWILIVAFNGNDYNKSTEKANLFPVEIKTLNSQVLDLADPVHICLIDADMAFSKAEAALGHVKLPDNANAGSRYKLGEATKQFVNGQLWWIFPLEFDEYWKWKQFPTVPGYIRVSAENPAVAAEVVQYNKQGKPIVIKYLNSACFENVAERYLRNNGYLKTNLQDFTFEVDENWNPYYTVSQVAWTIGYDGEVTTNVVILDLQTGNIQSCPISQVESKFPWIDRASPLSVIDKQALAWGEFKNAPWAIMDTYDGNRQKPTPGWYLTYNHGKCYWFTGWTSYSASSDLIGISLTDANTGKTVYYKTQGSTEDKAYETAQGQWNTKVTDYQPCELVPYNIYGMLTYVIPMSFKGQFQGVSLVSVTNKDIKSKGNTLEEALSGYRSSMASATYDRGVPSEGRPNNLTITAKIAEVGMPYLQGQNQMYPFTLVGIDKIFQINYSLQNAKVSFLKPGRQVTVVYSDTKEKVISCTTLDIPDIKLSDENPAQARWVEAQKSVKTETKRVSNIQENQEIIESGNLGEVNPEDLKKFIEAQKAKKK